MGVQDIASRAGALHYKAALGVQDATLNIAVPEFATAKVIAGVTLAARTLRPAASAFPEITATTEIAGQAVSATVRPVDILAGDPNRVAVIGRSMDAVNPYADALRATGVEVSTFSSKAGTISDDAIQQFDALKLLHGGDIPNAGIVNSKMFLENARWADSVRSQGYTVIDLGNPFGNPRTSMFYNIEQVRIFGKPPQ